MLRNLLLMLVFLFTASLAYSQTAVAGKVSDKESGEELIGATLQFVKDGVQAAAVATDFDGNYKVSIDPGTYDVLVKYLGYQDYRINGVVVLAGKTTSLPVQLGGDATILTEVIVTEYKVPLIDKDNTTSGGVITGEQIRNLPTKNISALASNTAGLSQVDEGDDVTIRGSRADATDYYIDGIRVSSSQLLPESEIEQLQVITGGIEAQYGDVTGGIISITTKGPSSKYSGSVEVESSQFLDSYGYNLVNANVSGPILKKKSGESILGFRLSGRYRYQKDDDPPATEIYQITDEALAALEADPIQRFGAAKVPAAENLTFDDVNILDYRPNEEQTRIDATAKLDARLSKNIDITFTGSYAQTDNKFTPTSGGRATWRLMNSHNNPTSFDQIIRGNFRFRHRLGNTDATAAEGDQAAKKGSIIQNALYTLQFGYQKTLQDIEDSRHEDNYFNYGYVGQFDYEWVPFVGLSDWSGAQATFGLGHVDNQRQFRGYKPGAINPVLANYNNNVDLENDNDFVAFNGFFVGDVTGIWQNMHTNVGQVYNLNRRQDADLFTFTASSSFDIVPGGSDDGRHSIQFGILYEQRYSRRYDINPRQLWTVARQQANRHILGVDTSTVIGTFDPGFPLNQTIPEIPLHDFLIDENAPGTFYRRIRDITNQSLSEFVNVDGLTPDQLSLDMFTAQELNDVGLIYYFGYDYLGNKLGNDVTFDDFFTARDANGIRTFPVGAFQPNYFAAYIQDKFTFNDITFRLGLRVDRYDANTKILADPYAINAIIGARDFYALDGAVGTQPGTIGDDFKVYVEADGSNVPKAFRDGDQWYNASGTPVNDGSLIFESGLVFPKYIDPDSDIRNENFNPDLIFEDYEPQVNWMPRLAFSFPISDDANFFAHYDVLVQRPPSNTLATALDYFYFEELPPLNNPNLRPEKTVDYEVGFRQKVSNTSALKISIYYKEMRDMIQRRTYTFVAPPVNQYDSFGNLDFGTIKGFSVQYDLRRTGNVTANLNYTLQFADGTGSDANSQRGLTSRGNIRNLIPLNFDERHRFTAAIDYRYGSGSRYTGPEWFGKQVLSNFGVNLQAIAVSGRPFTARETPLRFGGTQFEGAINGARKPWNFTLNLRIDKSFVLSKSEKFPLNLNVYFRVSNLLDARNIIDVYSASRSADSDGFLNSPFGEDAQNEVIRQGRNIEAFLASYQWAETRPDFFSLPRRMFLGAIFEF